MTAESDLERRIRILEDIEAIKKLKAKYWASVDSHNWEALAECMTEDLVFENPFFGKMEGRDFVVKVLKRSMRNVKTCHQGHNPDIEITGEATATGKWSLNDRVEGPDRTISTGYGIYQDEYVKKNGTWKIKTSILNYIFPVVPPKTA